MREEKRSFHKQRKWICPKCQKVRMQQVAERDSRSRRGRAHPAD